MMINGLYDKERELILHIGSLPNLEALTILADRYNGKVVHIPSCDSSVVFVHGNKHNRNEIERLITKGFYKNAFPTNDGYHLALTEACKNFFEMEQGSMNDKTSGEKKNGFWKGVLQSIVSNVILWIIAFIFTIASIAIFRFNVFDVNELFSSRSEYATPEKSILEMTTLEDIAPDTEIYEEIMSFGGYSEFYSFLQRSPILSSNGAWRDDLVSVRGNTFDEVLVFRGNTAFSRHSLGGLFTALSGYLGRTDNDFSYSWNVRFVTFNFYGDGELLRAFQVMRDELIPIAIDITGVYELKITYNVNNILTRVIADYALVNPTLQ